MPAPLLTPEIVEQARHGAGEAGAAWQRAFDLPAEVTVGESTDLLALVAQESWNAPGLAFIFSQASGAYALLVADATSALPAWISAPDATGKSKLATLAQELGLVLLPEALLPTAQQAARVDNIQEALLRSEPATGMEALTLSIRCGEITLPAVLLGVSETAKLLPIASDPIAESAAPIAEPAAPPHAAEPKLTPPRSRFASPPRNQEFEEGIPALPSYTRSLLKVRVPVVASLASTQISVGRILEIGPGSIIQFDQSCEQPLSLAIGEHAFAVGEAVKIGEKFGLRITSMVMPSERFWSVRGQRGLRERKRQFKWLPGAAITARMQLIPVIDLKGGIVVRGVGGNRNEYRPLVSSLLGSSDPGDVARALVDNFRPATIYVADLDAIMRGQLQDAFWETIASKGANLLVDAGVRTTQQADKYMARIRRQLAPGSRLIIGLETFETLGQLPALIGSFVFSLDLKQGHPIVRDPQWQHATPMQIVELVATSAIPTLIILDLADVGSGRGPSTLPLIRAVHEQYPDLELIAGGGVRNREDLLALQQAGASGALVASALHDRKISAADVPY